MNSAIEVLRDEIKYNFNQMGVHTYDKVIDEALLALEKQKLVWVLFCEEDCEGGMILGIYRDYESGKKELDRLAEKEGGIVKDNSYRVGVSVTSLSSYPLF